ncbi:protein of unknown function [Agreia sp. COWG]|nr:protein of unknown function [Agreia sp. COWG]
MGRVWRFLLVAAQLASRQLAAHDWCICHNMLRKTNVLRN